MPETIATRVENPGPVRLEALEGGRIMAWWPEGLSGLGVAIRSAEGEWARPIHPARGIDLFGAQHALVDVRATGEFSPSVKRGGPEVRPSVLTS